MGENHVLIGGIQRFSTEDGPGIRTTVFFKGCPLRCKWCHNPELLERGQGVLLSSKKCIQCGKCSLICPVQAIISGDNDISVDWDVCTQCGKCVDVCCAEAWRYVAREMSAKEIVEIVNRDSTFYKKTGGGVTLSGGEVLFENKFAYEVAIACKENDLDLAIETSGYGDQDALLELASISNHILYDMKMFDGDKHKEFTGVDNKLIIENLKALSSQKNIRNKIVIRMPLIAGINDSESEVLAIISMIKSMNLNKVELIPYHEMGVSKSRDIGSIQQTFSAPADEHLSRLKRIISDFDVSVEVMGLDPS